MLLGPMMVVVVAALLGWINPWVFSLKGHAVVVGESGLFVNVPGCSVGPVSWDGIRSDVPDPELRRRLGPSLRRSDRPGPNKKTN